MIEKPFGRNLVAAQTLNAVVHRTFSEDNVFRIDHYLGKKRTVDPILGEGMPTHEYVPGTWGLAQANALIASAGTWFDARPK